MVSCRVGDACRFLHDDKEKGTLTIAGSPPAAVNVGSKRVRFHDKREIFSIETTGKLEKIVHSMDYADGTVKKWKRSPDEVHAQAMALGGGIG